MKCCDGIFQELLSWSFAVSITGCRKSLSLIPALFFCLCGRVHSDLWLICLNEDDRQPPDTDNVDLWGKTPPLLSPLPVSFFRPGKKPQPLLLLLLSLFFRELYWSLRSCLSPPRLIDVSIADGDESLSSIENKMMKWDLRLDTVGCKSVLHTLVIIHI